MAERERYKEKFRGIKESIYEKCPYDRERDEMRKRLNRGYSQEELHQVNNPVSRPVRPYTPPAPAVAAPVVKPQVPAQPVEQKIEDQVRKDAKANGKELVPNKYHPDNRRQPGYRGEEESPLDRLNRGIKGTGAEHARSGGRQAERISPDNPWD